jgi:hypothetical protein
MEAYAAAGLTDNALAQARWLNNHRGRAYIESGCSWCQQPLDVFDTTHAHLRAAELLASDGKMDQAKAELKAFDSKWNEAQLPDHLRVRRAAVLGMFN